MLCVFFEVTVKILLTIENILIKETKKINYFLEKICLVYLFIIYYVLIICLNLNIFGLKSFINKIRHLLNNLIKIF